MEEHPSGTNQAIDEKEQNKQMTPDIKSKSLEETLAIPFVASYQPTKKWDFFEDYTTIRMAFTYDMETAITKVKQDIIERESQKEEQVCKLSVIESILQKLSYETVYQISSVPAIYQTDILSEILDETEKLLFYEFEEITEGEFDCIEFYSYLKTKKMELDDTIYLHIRPIDAKKRKEQDVTVYPDENICEGFQLVTGNYLYDYGIRNSEIIL